MVKTTKIRINLAEYDIVFLVLSKLIAANPEMRLGEIQCCLLDEHAQGDEINDHEQTLKKVKWKHFLWGHLKPSERIKGDDLQSVEGQLECVAEALDPLQFFIETFGEKRLAGEFEFVNEKPKGRETVKKTAAKKVSPKSIPAPKKSRTASAVAKKSVGKKSDGKKTVSKKSAPKKAPVKKKVAAKKKGAAKKGVVKKASKKKK